MLKVAVKTRSAHVRAAISHIIPTDSPEQLRDLFLAEAILKKSVHLSPHKHTRSHTDNGGQTQARMCKHKKEQRYIWCNGGGTFVKSWSGINCTQIKMDLAPVVGSVIHSDAAAEEDLSGVKSDASLSHPNTSCML